ncbi:hypothetical protein MAHJHV33_13450 [Mycobacterium avium subsp. hominissuis]
MGAQRASAQGLSADTPDGFGVAVVREEGQWRCAPMAPKSLTSLSAAETELRELRSSGAVFGLLDVDDEFFVIVRPAPSGTRLLLSDATATPKPSGVSADRPWAEARCAPMAAYGSP